MRAGKVLIFESQNADDVNVSAPDPVDFVLGGDEGVYKADIDVDTLFSIGVQGGQGVMKR